ncbi:MAG TPA: SRPBCC family protein [Devosiaceae bacterium]|jgi:uncharacterized protein YndB with AHSA1/START domain
MTERSIAHGTFVVERNYKASPAKVFAAFADPAIKNKWFGGPEEQNAKRSFDFRVGGKESNTGEFHGSTYSFDALYQDIIPNERIIYTYDMHLNGERISVSLATIEFKPTPAGTHMIVTENGAFLDGLDNVKQREAGTNGLMDALGRVVEG